MKFSLNKFLQVVDYVATPVLTAMGVPDLLVPVIKKGIRIAETATAQDGSPLTGPEKRAIVIDSVQTAIDGINIAKPGTLSPEIPSTVGRGIDLVVDTVNVINWHNDSEGAGSPQKDVE